MGLRFLRPTNPGSRHTILASFEGVCPQKPIKKLVTSNNCGRGRNHRGVITCRHRGGGHKKLYRKIDFWRKKLEWVGVAKSVEYDPNRNARIVRVYYGDGTKTYILAPKHLTQNQPVVAGFTAPIESRNALPLWKIPVRTNIHNVENRPGAGGTISRAAGTSVQIIAQEDSFTALRLPSGEVRLIPKICWATVGKVGNDDVLNTRCGKAGRIRWLGRRPSVRGKAINPVDHPHGGGEGRCPIGRSYPVTPWGKPRLGVKTRNPNKSSNSLILRRKR